MRIGLDISVLNDKQKKGIAVYTYNLIDALLKINKQDQFILFGIATFETFEYLKNLPFKNYPNVELKIFRMPAKFFRTVFLLWQKTNWPPIENFVGPVNIFHSFNWFLPPQRKGKVAATVFDMTPLLSPKWHQEKTVQLEKIRFSRMKEYADLVTTISENSKKDFLRFAPLKRVEVIYPAVSENFKMQKNKSKIEKVLRKYKLMPGYFLSVGTLEPRKNMAGLIKAYLASNLKNKLVLVGGKGWKNELVDNLLKKHQDKLQVLGYIADEDLPILYSQAWCLIYPSFYEGFGIPILEAQACGCPVVASNTSSLPEAGGKGAILVDPYSVEDIVRGIREVREGREKLIKAGLENVKKFNWNKSAKKLNFLYQQLSKE